MSYSSWGLILVQSVFLAAFVNFYWENGTRMFGVNQVLGSLGDQSKPQAPVRPLFTENGGLDFDVV
jgi:hypothetical protein